MVENALTIALGIVLAAIFVAPFVITTLLWVKIRAIEKTQYNIVPLGGAEGSNAFAQFQKELDSITGNRSSDLFDDMDPSDLGNFSRFDDFDEDKDV